MGQTEEWKTSEESMRWVVEAVQLLFARRLAGPHESGRLSS
jgi:hypothetical protein